MTRVAPLARPVLVSAYADRADLIQALMTSCHIPWYLDGNPFTGALACLAPSNCALLLYIHLSDLLPPSHRMQSSGGSGTATAGLPTSSRSPPARWGCGSAASPRSSSALYTGTLGVGVGACCGDSRKSNRMRMLVQRRPNVSKTL